MEYVERAIGAVLMGTDGAEIMQVGWKIFSKDALSETIASQSRKCSV